MQGRKKYSGKWHDNSANEIDYILPGIIGFDRYGRLRQQIDKQFIELQIGKNQIARRRGYNSFLISYFNLRRCQKWKRTQRKFKSFQRSSVSRWWSKKRKNTPVLHEKIQKRINKGSKTEAWWPGGGWRWVMLNNFTNYLFIQKNTI